MTNLLSRVVFTLFVVATVSALSVHAEPASSTIDDTLVHYSIESAFCSAGDCVKNLESAVSKIDGVISVKLNMKAHRFEIVFKEEVTDKKSLLQDITDATTLELVLIPVNESDD